MSDTESEELPAEEAGQPSDESKREHTSFSGEGQRTDFVATDPAPSAVANASQKPAAAAAEHWDEEDALHVPPKGGAANLKLTEALPPIPVVL